MIGQTVDEIWGDFRFFFVTAATAILDFQNLGILGVGRLENVKCINEPNFESMGKPLPRYGDFEIFPRWICDECVWTTHEGHLVVFITVQNLAGIDAVVLIMCMFVDFSSLAGKRPKIRGLGI